MDRYVDEIGQLMIDSVPEKKIVLTITAPGFSGAGSVNSGTVRVFAHRSQRTYPLAG